MMLRCYTQSSRNLHWDLEISNGNCARDQGLLLVLAQQILLVETALVLPPQIVRVELALVLPLQIALVETVESAGIVNISSGKSAKIVISAPTELESLFPAANTLG